MSSLNIPIEVAEAETGMAQAIFNELTDYLQQLASEGNTQVIDLSGLPLNGADHERLEQLLGRGEVTATLETMGTSHIHETGFSGIWWIRHFSADQQLISEFIEVAWVPDILKAHPDDVNAAAAAMQTSRAQQQRSENA
jgi:hydrogenase-1 operon protein HyaF